IAFILNDSDSVAVFYNRDLQPIIDGVRNQAPAVRHYIRIESNGDGKDYEALISAAATDFTPPDIQDDDLAELFYTSGTTANPKGIMMTHRNLYLHALHVIGGLAVDDTVVQLHTIPHFHVNGRGTPHMLTCMGARHIIVKKFDPTEVLELIQRERAT